MVFDWESLKSRLMAKSNVGLQQILFWSGAIIVALVAILFAKASTFGNGFFMAFAEKYPILAFGATPLGFAAIVWLTRRFLPGAEGSGIPQAIVAINSPDLAERGSLLSLKIAFGKILMTTLGICVGASVGREGPTVQVGASIMDALARFLKLPSPHLRRAMILAGGAAGISAAFNTPLAGVLFAIEELSRQFEEKTSGAVFTSVIVAGFVSMAALGHYTYFGSTHVSLTLAQAWQPVILCGLTGGLLGGLFSRLLILLSNGLPGACGRWVSAHPVYFAGICGLALALIGLLSGHSVFGTGYQQAKGLVEGTQPLPITFGLEKMAATVFSYASGIPGGIFAPSLAVGAGFGANFAQWMPDSPLAAVTILGMVGYFTGVVQVPITATIIIMEMTDDQSLTLPLMATALLANAVSKIVCPQPLYRTLAQGFAERITARMAQDKN